jgi:hypothetical protein
MAHDDVADAALSLCAAIGAVGTAVVEVELAVSDELGGFVGDAGADVVDELGGLLSQVVASAQT